MSALDIIPKTDSSTNDSGHITLLFAFQHQHHPTKIGHFLKLKGLRIASLSLQHDTKAAEEEQSFISSRVRMHQFLHECELLWKKCSETRCKQAPAKSGSWMRTGDAIRTLTEMKSWPHSASSNGSEKDDG